MKILALSLFLIALNPALIWAEEPWSIQDKAMFTTTVALAYIDFRQTSQFERFGIGELNPLARPIYKNKYQLATTIIVGYGSLWYSMNRYPRLRKILPWIMLVQAIAVTRNREKLLYHGVRIPF